MVGRTNVGGSGSSGSAGPAFAYIRVSYPEGSICTATSGTKTITAADTSGLYIFPIPEPSSASEDWTVSCTDNTNTKSDTITISSQYQIESISLAYSRLPAEYQEVEYLQNVSRSNQYITTGQRFTETTEIDIQFMFTTAVYGYVCKYGMNLNQFSTQATMPAYMSNAMLYYLTMNNSIASSATVGTKMTTAYNNASHQVVENGRVLGTFSDFSGLTNIGGIYLFGNTAETSNSEIRIYSFSIKNNITDGIIQELVPCYRKSDNEIGMYDIVSNTFLTNSGVGSFNKGADV